MKNGIFKLYSTATYRFWGNVSRGTVYLYLPQDMNLNMIDIEMGAGNLESIDLSANEIDLEAGAGGVIAEGLYGSEIDVMIGAGKALPIVTPFRNSSFPFLFQSHHHILLSVISFLRHPASGGTI